MPPLAESERPLGGPDPRLTSGETTDGDHHALVAHEVVLLLQTHGERGLTDDEAAERLERYGPNALPQTSSGGFWKRLVRQLDNPLVYVLLVAGTVTGLLGDTVGAVVIFGVVAVNTLVGYLQESRAEASLEALRAMVQTRARVRRDGRSTTIPSEEVVPGDVVLVRAGDKVPADLRLLHHVEVQVDESALTGESLPVVKDEDAVPAETPVSDRRNMLYSGTLVTHGTGVGVAVATGGATELGEIHRLVGGAEQLATPLTRKLTAFSKVLTVVILGLAALTFALGLVRGESGIEMFHAAVALAVGAIPEGLPAAVTITLAIGVGRMARRRAVIRRLPAVETLGSTTVICSDKTGTLTQNEMTVRAVWTPAARYRVSGVGYAPVGDLRLGDGAPDDGAAVGRTTADPTADAALAWTLRVGALCTDAVLTPTEGGAWHLAGDPTEGALVSVALKGGVDVDTLRTATPRERTIPFSSERQYMATVHVVRAADVDLSAVGGIHPASDGAVVVLVKGAGERVLGMCSRALGADGEEAPLERSVVLREAERLAAGGLRVLATAIGRVDRAEDATPDALAGALVLTGLVGMLDPPRPEAVRAVAACHTAGIAVKMITGDHAATARAIAEQVGLRPEAGGGEGLEVLTGAALEEVPEADLPAAVERAVVFARVSPEQKLRLVEALQTRRHVVAMTGDGVNDAPALRQADIGVAMGLSGTEVAKEAADMVLTDDDFATIEAAVEEGRGVFDNLTKFIVWTLPTNAGEGLVILVAILLGLTLPILPVQILWINMTTAVLLGLMLAFEPKEAGIMIRAPRAPDQPIITRALVVRIVLVSSIMVAGAWWVFGGEVASGAPIEQARTAAVNLFVVVEAAYLFSCRSLTRSVWRIGLFSNRLLLVGVGVQGLAQVAITYVPAMNTVFETAPIPGDAWLRILVVAVVVSAAVGLDKVVRRGVASRNPRQRHRGRGTLAT